MAGASSKATGPRRLQLFIYKGTEAAALSKTTCFSFFNRWIQKKTAILQNSTGKNAIVKTCFNDI
jgi:hypothetical protein